MSKTRQAVRGSPRKYIKRGCNKTMKPNQDQKTKNASVSNHRSRGLSLEFILLPYNNKQALTAKPIRACSQVLCVETVSATPKIRLSKLQMSCTLICSLKNVHCSDCNIDTSVLCIQNPNPPVSFCFVVKKLKLAHMTGFWDFFHTGSIPFPCPPSTGWAAKAKMLNKNSMYATF